MRIGFSGTSFCQLWPSHLQLQTDHQVSLKLPNSSRRDFRAEAHDLQSQGGRSAAVFHPGIHNSLGFWLCLAALLIFLGSWGQTLGGNWCQTPGRAWKCLVELSFQPGLEASVQRSQAVPAGAALQVLGEKLPWPSSPGNLRSKKGKKGCEGHQLTVKDVKGKAGKGMAMQLLDASLAQKCVGGMFVTCLFLVRFCDCETELWHIWKPSVAPLQQYLC